MDTPIDTSRQTSDDVTTLRRRVAELEQILAQQRLADAAVRERQVHFQTLYEDTPAMAFVLSLDGTILSLNRYAAAQLGYSSEELLGQSVLQIFDLTDHHTVLRQLTVCGNMPNSTLGWELQKVRKDGSRLWVRETARTIRDAAGSLTILVVCEDITARKAAEEQLRAVIDTATDAIFMKDTRGRYELINAAGARTIGKPVEEIVGKTDQELFPPETAKQLMKNDRQVLIGGTQHHFEAIIPFKGEPRTFSSIKTPYRDPQGKVIGLVGVSRDITDQKHLEEQRGKSERLFASFMENLPGLAWIKDTSGRYVYLNGAFERAFHVKLSDWKGKTDFDVWPKAVADQFTTNDRHVLSTNTPILTVETAPQVDGVHVSLVSKFPIPNEQGSPILVGGVAVDITERKQAEEALRLTQFAVDRAADLAFWIDREARFAYVNDAACQRLGYTCHELLSMTVADIDSNYQTESWPQHWEALRHTGRLRFETVHRTKSGELYPVEIVANYATFEGKEYNFAFARDITEQKRAEAALRDSEARWKTLFEHAGVGIAQLSLSGQFLRVNARLCETLGYSSKTLCQRTFQEITHPDDLEPNVRLMHELVTSARPSFSMEKRYLRSDGVWLWTNLTVSLVRSTSGAPAYFIKVVEDISERKQAEEALQQSETRLHRFVADAPVGLVIMDAQKRLLSANKAFCALTGYTEAEIIGSTYALYTHPDDLPDNLALTDEFFRGERPGYAYEKRYVRKPGDIIWVAVKTTSIELPGHVGPLLLAVVEDITQRKQAMDERERISQDLHDDVLQSLYAVGMGLEATKEHIKPISRSAAKRLEGSVAQLNGVIHEVRSFIPHMQTSSRTDGNFEQALRCLVGSFTATGTGDIAVTIDAAAAAVLPLDHCRDVIGIAKEAISNSLRHANATRHTVTLHRHRSKLRLEIADNGTGFLPRRSRKGIGLSNMRTRAKKLGARLTIDSAPRQGTRIVLDLPVR
jgi:PAS domain S-box-containing protein